MPKHSRREFAGLLLALLVRPARAGGQPIPTPALPSRTKVRRYRADAVILLLGIPIYRRAAVGSGEVSLEESGEGPSTLRTLFFAGGSDPKRAHGLKRLGWIRETVHGVGSAPTAIDYFGVLSSSPEESLEHARKSIATEPTGRTLYSAVNGHHTAGHSRSAVTHFDFSSDADWSDHSLIDEAQSTFHAKVDWRDTPWPNSANHAPPTFLFQLATLLEQHAKRAAGRYVYNEQEYLLEIETSQPSGSDRLRMVRGGVRNQLTRHQTTFRFWLDESPDSIVPVRIEFQPRSFLRLTFEALPA